jgi:hypothetical protein
MEENLPSPLPNPFDVSQDWERELIEPSVLAEPVAVRPELRAPNFPFFFPLIYHNIDAEIPSVQVKTVKLMFYGATSFAFNLFFCFLTSFFSANLQSEPALTSFHFSKEFVMSLFFFLVFSPLIFYVQYFPFYDSARGNSVSKSARIIQLFVMGIICVFLLGIPGTGMVGILYAVAAFRSDSSISRFLASIATVWHGVNAGVEFVVFAHLRTGQPEPLGEESRTFN